MTDLKVLLQSMRVPFLLLTPVCVFLGASIAVSNQVNIDTNILVLALLAALSAHISVNTLNEFFDFKSGLDLITIKTPFSGGSGALPGKPEMVNAVAMVGIVSLVVTIIIGSYFIWRFGGEIIPLGFIGVILITSYTTWINKYPLFCLLAPGVGFGFIMVVGTQYVLMGQYLSLSWLVAVVPFFQVSNLLLLNQYPDIEADASVGRNHFPIAYGVERSNLIYGLFVLGTAVAIVGYLLVGYLPSLSMIALLPTPLALFSLSGAIKYREKIGMYPQYLAANVAVAILTPMLLGISIIYG